MAKKMLGHTDCPECGFKDAEVGEDKNGNPYRYCPDCNAQYFTRGESTRAANLKKKMRPLRPETTLGAPAAESPKKKGALETLLGGGRE